MKPPRARIYFALLTALSLGLSAALPPCACAESPTGPVRTGPEVMTATLNRPLKEEADRPRLRLDPPAPDADDAAIDDFVRQLLAEMTLSEKVGQMNQVFPPGSSLSDDLAGQIRDGAIGSVFYTGDAKMLQRLQRIAVEESRLGIPLIPARDVIHGFRTIAPIPLGQAATWNAELVAQGAAIAAAEARREGVRWTFAPMVDISRDPRWGRIAESLGEDPLLASVLGTAMVRGFQGDGDLAQGIAACPKHFVAYGLAEGGRDYNSVMVSQNELHNVYLRPFRACVDEGAATLMTSFNTINGVPATGHRRLLTGLLKQQWGFNGLIVSDWGSTPEMVVHGFAADDRAAAAAAARAGLDMDMAGNCFHEHLPDLVSAGTVDESRVDDAVSRILRVKVQLGLFDQPFGEQEGAEPLCDEHLEVARQLAAESLVLLKNDGTLPLDAKTLRRVAVIGPLAEAPRDQLGTWVLDARPEETRTPLAAIKAALGPDVEVVHVPCQSSKYEVSKADLAVAAAAAKSADAVLLFVGEEEALSGEAHSRATLDLPGGQAELVAAVCKGDAPVVMAVMAGRPLAIGGQCDAASAVLYAWHPGTMGGPAIADVLFGALSPCGKLPVTFPRSVGQVPLYYNHPSTGRPAPADYQFPPWKDVRTLAEERKYKSHYIDEHPTPLFPFGYGLSYGRFSYSDLELSRTEVPADGMLAVHVRVSNDGPRAGVETVQVYVRDMAAQIVRPVRELKAFRRISLEPGESQVMEFALTGDDLSYDDDDGRRVLEPGEFQLWVGGDSAAELSGRFRLVD